jgi:hypothetical protein
MYSALWPYTHGVKHYVADVRCCPLVHHVVMFIDVQDVGRRRQRASFESRPPIAKGFVVVNYDGINWAISPRQQSVETLRWALEFIEVI